MRAPLYRPDLDRVAVDGADRTVVSGSPRLDPATGVVLVEPVGWLPEHRGRAWPARSAS
jgi:hypothetical protein